MLTQNKRLFVILLAVVFLLSLPLVAMQFTTEVNWSVSDFMVAAFLLGTTGLVSEMILRMVKHAKHRLILCGVTLLCLLIVWIELAVGVFGTPFAGQ